MKLQFGPFKIECDKEMDPLVFIFAFTFTISITSLITICLVLADYY